MYSLSGWPLNLPWTKNNNLVPGLAADSSSSDIPAIHEIYFDRLLGKEAVNQDLDSPPAAPP